MIPSEQLRSWRREVERSLALLGHAETLHERGAHADAVVEPIGDAARRLSRLLADMAAPE